LMIHRDMKPSNILLDKDGHVKVFDFGLITGHESASVDLNEVEGTPYYLSPEALREGAHLDNRSDLYSIGTTMYHMISGFPPFNYDTLDEVLDARLTEPAPDLRDVFPHAHPSVVAITKKMMQPNPDDRYFTAAEAKRDVELALAGQNPEIAVLD
jgi:serine/threonine protein kinase